MKINQLFRKKMEDPHLTQFLNCYGLSGLNDRTPFSKNRLLERGTVGQLEGMVQELEEYYLPCKSKVYLRNLTTKRAITILKQFIRVHGYILLSTEMNSNNCKVIFYNILSEVELSRSKTMRTFSQTSMLAFN